MRPSARIWPGVMSPMLSSAAGRGTKSSPTGTSWVGQRHGTRPPIQESRWRLETAVTSAATCKMAERYFKHTKPSGEGSKRCCLRCSCLTSLRTVDRRPGKIRPQDGRRTRLDRGGGATDDRLLSGRVLTSRLVKSDGRVSPLAPHQSPQEAATCVSSSRGYPGLGWDAMR
jgi:hypothetical protein